MPAAVFLVIGPTGDCNADHRFGDGGGVGPFIRRAGAERLGRQRRFTAEQGLDRLDGRQRTVFMLCHYGDCSPREVSAITGLNESTVRVHLFRAARKLRGLLGGKA